MLGATENVTAAGPVPAEVGGPGLVFVSQLAFVVTCHTQVGPCGIDSVKVTVPPLAGTLALVGVTVCAQETAGCVTLTVFPAIVSDPSLALYPFAATETVTVPESVLPEAPLRTASHAVLLTAVQLQPPPCVRLTVNVTVSPPGCALTVVGLTLYRQGTPSCVTVTAWSAMVSVPNREAPVFALALYETAPAPVPLPPPVIAIHPSSLDAVQLHSADTDNEMLPVPPLS